MFLGTHTPRLDEKGRLILPAKFRDELAAGLVITRGQDRCLAIWPMEAFVAQTSELRTASSSSKQVRDYQRMLASGASDEVAGQAGPDHHPAAPADATRRWTRSASWSGP